MNAVCFHQERLELEGAAQRIQGMVPMMSVPHSCWLPREYSAECTQEKCSLCRQSPLKPAAQTRDRSHCSAMQYNEMQYTCNVVQQSRKEWSMFPPSPLYELLQPNFTGFNDNTLRRLTRFYWLWGVRVEIKISYRRQASIISLVKVLIGFQATIVTIATVMHSDSFSKWSVISRSSQTQLDFAGRIWPHIAFGFSKEYIYIPVTCAHVFEPRIVLGVSCKYVEILKLCASELM